MTRLTRKNIKVFAGSASNNGIFGSLQANNPTTTSDIEEIQSLNAWDEGWNSATDTSEELPPLEEFQGVQYVTTYQQAYLMQEGVPEWAAAVTYYTGSLVKNITSTGFQIYCSLTDNNTGNILSDTSNWKIVMDSDDLYVLQSQVTSALNTTLDALYPVGSLYIGTQDACPLSTLISNSIWEVMASQIVINVDSKVAVAGTGAALGMTNTSGGALAGYMYGMDSGSGHGYSQPVITTSTLGYSTSSFTVLQGATGVTVDSATSGLTGAATSTALTCNIWQRTA